MHIQNITTFRDRTHTEVVERYGYHQHVQLSLDRRLKDQNVFVQICTFDGYELQSLCFFPGTVLHSSKREQTGAHRTGLTPEIKFSFVTTYLDYACCTSTVQRSVKSPINLHDSSLSSPVSWTTASLPPVAVGDSASRSR